MQLKRHRLPSPTASLAPSVLAPVDAGALSSFSRRRLLVAAIAAKTASREVLKLARSMRQGADDACDSGDYPYLIARDVIDAIDAHYGKGDQYLHQLIVDVWTRLTLEG
jgi:hypothetical protein